MTFNKNGIIVQQTNYDYPWTRFLKNINYKGIRSLSEYLLFDFIKDKKHESLQNEIWYKKINDDCFLQLNFITDFDLLCRYLKVCQELSITFRLLFLESQISDEIWDIPLPKMKFIGYEYCECPFDHQVISDLDAHETFQRHRDKLNEHGLFSSLEDAQAFKIDYDKEFEAGIIGDGDMETFIFRVSEVSEEYIEEILLK